MQGRRFELAQSFDFNLKVRNIFEFPLAIPTSIKVHNRWKTFKVPLVETCAQQGKMNRVDDKGTYECTWSLRISFIVMSVKHTNLLLHTCIITITSVLLTIVPKKTTKL